jgi:hypothetical protein
MLGVSRSARCSASGISISGSCYCSWSGSRLAGQRTLHQRRAGLRRRALQALDMAIHIRLVFLLRHDPHLRHVRRQPVNSATGDDRLGATGAGRRTPSGRAYIITARL